MAAQVREGSTLTCGEQRVTETRALAGHPRTPHQEACALPGALGSSTQPTQTGPGPPGAQAAVQGTPPCLSQQEPGSGRRRHSGIEDA